MQKSYRSVERMATRLNADYGIGRQVRLTERQVEDLCMLIRSVRGKPVLAFAALECAWSCATLVDSVCEPDRVLRREGGVEVLTAN